MDNYSDMNKRHERHRGEAPMYPLWVSDVKKRAYDSALAKDYIDYFDMASEFDSDRSNRILENLEIHAGRWPAIQNINPSISLTLGNESVTLGSGKLLHYPIIDRVSKGIVSDLIIRPLIPIIRDNSSKARNFRERIRLERVKSYFYNTIIQPEMSRITMQYDQEFGIADPVSLDIEAQKQREFDIQTRFKEETPEEVFDSLQRYNTPDELVAEALLKEGSRYTKLKNKLDIGAEYAVTAAEEYYRVGIINKMPHVEALNPRWVVWSGSEHVEDCEDGQFAKYVQYLTPEDAITKYSRSLSGPDIKRLATLYSQIPGYNSNSNGDKGFNSIERTLVDTIANNPSIQDNMNIRTREGQEKLKALYASIGHGTRTGYGIREAYVTFRWIRKVKFVTRMVSGKLETYIRDEHYVKDPFAGDVEVVEKGIPQAYQGIKLGEEFYIDVGPIPGQYNNINSPFDVKLGIYGGKYNTFHNNVRNASFVDLGKPWQYKYNVLMKKMEEHQATDIGKVLLGTTTMIPKGWSWSQWYQSLFLTRTAIVSNHREGVNNLDTSIFRSIDLSRTVDIENDIRQLEYFENKIISSMYYSPQKLGAVSQYATNQNTQVAISGVDKQMYRFYNRNRQIKESVLNALLQVCIFSYKDNEDVKSTVLDDFLKAHYELNFNSTEFSNFTLNVVDDFRESEKLEKMRNLALTLLQNGMTAGQLSAVMNAESMSELQQLLETADRKVKEEGEKQFQREESILEKQRKAAESQLELQQMFIKAEADREREVRIRLAEINSMMLENANDVNRDKVNDSIQKALLEIQSTEKIETMKLNHDKEIKDKAFELEHKKIGSSKS